VNQKGVLPSASPRKLSPPSFVRRAGIPLVLATVCFLLYAPTFSYPFINFDDALYVTGNARVLRGLTPDNIAWAFGNFAIANYHPLALLSHMIDVQLFGVAPGAHHAMNVLIHGASTVLLYHALVALTGATWRSAAVAALFGWHPTRVESVAWIAERKDVLCAFFVIVTFIAYTWYAREPRVRRYALFLFAYALALASKPMAVTVPALLLMLDYWPLGRLRHGAAENVRRSRPLILILEKLPLLILAAASTVLTYFAQRDAKAVESLADLPLAARIANAIVSCARYLRMTIFPTNLACYYPREAWQPWQVALCAALLVAITAAVMYSRRGYAIVGWGFFLVSLMPVIGVLQVGQQAMADRYTYLPLIGVFILIVWALGEVAQRWPATRRAMPLAGAAALAAYAAATVVQVTYWRSDESLFAHAVDVTHDNHLAHHLLAVALAQQGRVDEAAAHYKRAAAIAPLYVDPRLNLGILAEQSGDFVQSERWLDQVLSYQPGHRGARFALANLRLRQRRPRDAATMFEQLVREDPSDVSAYVNLGAALDVLGDRAGAEAAYRSALQIEPNDPDAKANLDALLTPGAARP
jgi:Flp pilus assembly protein TadD